MKKLISIVLLAVLSLSLLAGCGVKASDSNEIKIGVSPEPHSKLVNLIKEDLEKDGVKVTLIEFTDYIKPNLALNDGEIDANFFQHLPYLDGMIAEKDLKLVSIGNVHVEPMALYSDKYKTLDELPNGAEIAIPNDSVNGGRALILLQDNGLIKLKDGAGLESTEKDIVENPKNIKITAIEAAGLPRVLKDIVAKFQNL